MKMPLVAVIGSLILIFTLQASAGEFAGLFTSLGAGARSAGLGLAQVAVVDDAFATFWNPAGLIKIKTMDFNAAYSTYFGLVNQKVINFAHTHDQGVLAFSYVSNWVDGIQSTSYTDGRPLLSGSDFSYNSAVLIISKADFWGSEQKIAWGWSLKLMGEGFSSRAGGSGIGLDIGLQQQLSPKLRWGLVLGNVVKTPYEWNTPSKTVETLPFMLKVGFASKLSPKLEGAFDLEFQTNTPMRYHAGLEYSAFFAANKDYALTLRSGLDNGLGTLGLGLRYLGFKLDYAYRLSSSDYLSPTHLVSIGFSKF